ncbi:NUDIX domain-containing protein [Marinilactibacillus sp. Marseille-P9653]|uniref:NUDIX domain-containing protein n=1 Tax=Marinilactibacillus sp. Marseille-P9653 TaxID=2866583 RepID=UPI001CE3BFA7|nr:NUDIX domain-containing protein [Marinilactibacillus sp. Marseille-P9653]
MIAKNHYVACTVLVKDENDRYVFLVKKESKGFSFPATEVKPKKTALACIIERMKEVLSIDVEKLELNELTNAVVQDNRVPLFVFTYEDESVKNPLELLTDDNELTWEHSEKITKTLEDWEISGVPQFLLI